MRSWHSLISMPLWGGRLGAALVPRPDTYESEEDSHCQSNPSNETLFGISTQSSIELGETAEQSDRSRISILHDSTSNWGIPPKLCVIPD